MFRTFTILSVVLSLMTAPWLIEPTAAATEDVGNLVAVLKSDASHKDKVDACRQLAMVGNKDAVPALAALLGDEKLSHMARYGLEPIPDSSVDDALRTALDSVKGRPLVGVIGSLGVRKDPKAIKQLSGLLRDSDAEVARASAKALGKIGGAEAIRVLQEMLMNASAAALRPAVADACLACAESLLANGKPTEAAALYDSVGKAELPKHFRIAAMQGAVLARKQSSQ